MDGAEVACEVTAAVLELELREVVWPKLAEPEDVREALLKVVFWYMTVLVPEALPMLVMLMLPVVVAELELPEPP